jgi:hypothetical protein
LLIIDLKHTAERKSYLQRHRTGIVGVEIQKLDIPLRLLLLFHMLSHQRVSVLLFPKSNYFYRPMV